MNVEAIYSLLNRTPEEVYNEIFEMRGITIRNKLSIAASCMNDEKAIANGEPDPKDRHRTIKRAGKSLQQLVAKQAVANAIY